MNMTVTEAGEAILALYDVWQERNKLHAEGNKLCAEGNKHRNEGNKLYAEGAKLYAEGAKLHAEAAKLYAEGAKLYAEGDKLWKDSVEKHYGKDAKITGLTNYTCQVNNDIYGLYDGNDILKDLCSKTQK